MTILGGRYTRLKNRIREDRYPGEKPCPPTPQSLTRRKVDTMKALLELERLLKG